MAIPIFTLYVQTFRLCIFQKKDINIDKNVANGQHFKFDKHGNCNPGTLPGDLIIVINYDTVFGSFTLSGNNKDLLYTQSILLSEALCGGSFKIKTPDDRIFLITFNEIKPGDTKIIDGAGVGGGKIIISFNIVFPSLDNAL